MDILEQLDGAATATSTVATGVQPDQLAKRTPCDQWNVQELMNHLTSSLQYFAARAEGKEATMPQPASPATLQETIDGLVAAANAAAAGWKQPGALQRKAASPFGEVTGEFMANITLTEMLMHGWDLARATGQVMSIDSRTAEAMLTAAKANLPPQARQTAFAPEQSAPAGAPALDQLAAFLGRTV
jgi:uncharacterized protein (TIGR03086 family)